MMCVQTSKRAPHVAVSETKMLVRTTNGHESVNILPFSLMARDETIEYRDFLDQLVQGLEEPRYETTSTGASQ